MECIYDDRRCPCEAGGMCDDYQQWKRNKKMNVIMSMIETGDQGTLSHFVLGDGTSYYALELPARNNQTGISCILPMPGDDDIIYTCKWLYSNRFGRNVYHVMGTKDRSDVEIHPGNFAGDRGLDWQSDVRGCIMLGMHSGSLMNNPNKVQVARIQQAILASDVAMHQFEAKQGGADFQLTIRRPIPS